MKEQDVITLDNGANYLLVDEYELDDNKFFLSIGVDEEKQLLDEENICFLYAGEDEEGEFVEIVEDEETLRTLYNTVLIEVADEDDPAIADKLLESIKNKLGIEGSN